MGLTPCEEGTPIADEQWLEDEDGAWYGFMDTCERGQASHGFIESHFMRKAVGKRRQSGGVGRRKGLLQVVEVGQGG